MKKKYIWISLVIVVLTALAIYLLHNQVTQLPSAESTYSDTLTVASPAPELLYQIPIDSFSIESGTVKRNQFLADILLDKGLDYPQIDQLVKISKPYFDFRKLRVGNKYTCFISPDSLQQLKYFVYEIDNTGYITVTFGDSITASLNQKEIKPVEKEAYGIINSSLWNTIHDNNLSPMLAIDLSDIYAWAIDFFGIEKGDYFKVLYREDYVDDQSVGIGQIHAAVFFHHKKPYYAFNFEEDSTWDFFDENGQSLRKAFLKAPLHFSRISSRYSNHRWHPVLKIYRPHHGVDYAAPMGTPVHSIGDGRVIHKGWDPHGGGNYIKIKHNSIYTTIYMHLSGFARGLHVGENVKQGQLIGFVGMTGIATGPHLDFRVSKNGHLIDPLKVESPPVNPVKNEYMAAYKSFIKPIKQQIDNMQPPKAGEELTEVMDTTSSSTF